MDEQSVTERLDALSKKIDAVYVSVEKTRRYLFWTFVVMMVVFVLPLIGLAFAIPAFLSSYTGALGSMGTLSY